MRISTQSGAFDTLPAQTRPRQRADGASGRDGAARRFTLPCSGGRGRPALGARQEPSAFSLQRPRVVARKKPKPWWGGGRRRCVGERVVARDARLDQAVWWAGGSG